MEEAMKYFLKKLLGHKIFRCMVSCATKFSLKKIFKTLCLPLSYILNVRSQNNLRFIILKCSRLFICFFCFYFTFTVQLTVLNCSLQFSWLEKERKKELKIQPSRLLKALVFSKPLLFQRPPNYQFLIFFPTAPLIPRLPHLFEILE